MSRRVRVIVCDDGGFPTVNPDLTGNAIGLDPYKRILDLANGHDLVIPIAVTACFVDVNNVSGLGVAGPDAEALVQFLLDHQRRLPLWNHGLTHRYQGYHTEFALYDPENSVPQEVQRTHLEKSQAVFSDLGFECPIVFVPPAHAWEPGVTDRIAKSVGLEFIAIREYEKRALASWFANPGHPYICEWTDSEFLKTLYRAGVGVPFNQTRFTRVHYLKASQYIRPTNALSRLLVWRRSAPPRQLDHFFAHVQNLTDPDSYKWWDGVISRLEDEFDQSAV